MEVSDMESLSQTIINDKLAGSSSGRVEKDICGNERSERIDFSHVLYRNLIRQQFRWRNVLVSPLILEAQLILHQMCCRKDPEDARDSKTLVQLPLDDYLQVKDRFANREQMIQHYERIFNSIASTQKGAASSSSSSSSSSSKQRDEEQSEAHTADNERMTTPTTTYFIMELVMLFLNGKCVQKERLCSIPLSDEWRQLAQKSFMTRIVSHSKDIVYPAPASSACAHNCQHKCPPALSSNFRAEQLLTECLRTKCQAKDQQTAPVADGGGFLLDVGAVGVDGDDGNDGDGDEGFILSSVTFVHKWFLPFSGYRSGYGEFHMKTENGADTSKSVLMMFDNEILVKFMEIDELDARAVELPFEYTAAAAVADGDDADDWMPDGISMLLLLPNQRDGLHRLELNLTSIKLNEISDRMQMENVQMLLPKFHIDWSSSLKSTLENMGLEYLFHQPASLPLTYVYQRTTIDVHEMGSEPTAPKVYRRCIQRIQVDPLQQGQKSFLADHPFFFAIRRADIILLMGHVISV